MKDYEKVRMNNLYHSILDLSFYSAGIQECKPNHSYGPKIRPYQLIHFVLCGKGEFHINGHIYHLSKGDAFIIPSEKVCYYKTDANEPWCYIWINFSGINSQMYIYELMNSVDDTFIIHNLDIDKYKDKISKIFELDTNTISRRFKCNSIFLDIMSMLFDDLHLNEKKLSNYSIIDDIKHYLDINYPEQIKIKDVAKEFGIHPNYMTQIFHDKFGISPKNYLKDLKLKKAQCLLKTTDLPISIISDSLGFHDQLTFSKIFKAKFFISPSEYRKQ